MEVLGLAWKVICFCITSKILHLNNRTFYVSREFSRRNSYSYYSHHLVVFWTIFLQFFCEMKNLLELDLRGNIFLGQLPLCLGSLTGSSPLIKPIQWESTSAKSMLTWTRFNPVLEYSLSNKSLNTLCLRYCIFAWWLLDIMYNQRLKYPLLFLQEQSITKWSFFFSPFSIIIRKRVYICFLLFFVCFRLLVYFRVSF